MCVCVCVCSSQSSSFLDRLVTKPKKHSPLSIFLINLNDQTECFEQPQHNRKDSFISARCSTHRPKRFSCSCCCSSACYFHVGKTLLVRRLTNNNSRFSVHTFVAALVRFQRLEASTASTRTNANSCWTVFCKRINVFSGCYQLIKVHEISTFHNTRVQRSPSLETKLKSNSPIRKNNNKAKERSTYSDSQHPSTTFFFLPNLKHIHEH